MMRRGKNRSLMGMTCFMNHGGDGTMSVAASSLLL